MNISLPKEHQDWIAAKVAAGASIDQVIEHAITASMLWEKEVEKDNLAWAKPLVDDAIAQVQRGEFITLEEHRARNTIRLSKPLDE